MDVNKINVNSVNVLQCEDDIVNTQNPIRSDAVYQLISGVMRSYTTIED